MWEIQNLGSEAGLHAKRADMLRAHHAGISKRKSLKKSPFSIFGRLHNSFASWDVLLNLSSAGRNQQKSASLYNTSKKVTTSTYQADQNEKNKCYFSEDRPARYVAVACERKGCAFMQIKQPSTYLLWTL